jgi:hypothetical protein
MNLTELQNLRTRAMDDYIGGKISRVQWLAVSDYCSLLIDELIGAAEHKPTTMFAAEPALATVPA